MRMKIKKPENLTVSEVYNLVDALHYAMRCCDDDYACLICAHYNNDCVQMSNCKPVWIGLVENDKEESNT